MATSLRPSWEAFPQAGPRFANQAWAKDASSGELAIWVSNVSPLGLSESK